MLFCVVYRTIPTSNHNFLLADSLIILLYIVLFLHQTTTQLSIIRIYRRLYIVLFLHQTTTVAMLVIINCSLYIVLFLHQTTTYLSGRGSLLCCISYYSYIKPQLVLLLSITLIRCISYYSYIKPQRLSLLPFFRYVVYRTIPTSNHN